jgi:hypothetical protein
MEPRVGRNRPLKWSISNLRVGIGPDRSGMHSAAPEYESVAQISQRSSTSHVAGGVTAGRKVWEELCICHTQGRREAISATRTIWYERNADWYKVGYRDRTQQTPIPQGDDRRLATRADDERLISKRYTSAARTHGAASVGLVAPRRVG